MEKGFSLIETVVVLAILGVILSFGLATSLDSLRATIFRSERQNILTALERARSKSMNNYLQSPHGTCLDNLNPNKPIYVVFPYPYTTTNPNNEYIEGNKAVEINSTPNIFFCANGGIIFSQLSGKTSNVSISIKEEGRITTIAVNQEGRINW